MEGFSFVTPVTGLNRPNTGKEDDDDSYNRLVYKFHTSSYNDLLRIKMTTKYFAP
jgi:hypothetical protein